MISAGPIGAALIVAAACGGNPSTERAPANECPAGSCADEENRSTDGASAASPSSGDPEESEAGSLVYSSCNPLSDWQRVDTIGATTSARVEAHLESPAGDEIVLVGPDPQDVTAVRAFMGREGHLREVAGAIRPFVDGPRVWEFEARDGDGLLGRYSLSGVYAEQGEEVPGASGSLFRGSNELGLKELSRTRLALAGLDFECHRPSVDGWALSNDPPRHDPPSACVSQPLRRFRCFDFPAGTLTDPDPRTFARSVEARLDVLEVGRGLPPGSGTCQDDATWRLDDAPATELAWARVERAGAEGLLVTTTPGISLPFAPGSSVDVTYATDLGGIGGPRNESLVVRDTAGALLLWLGSNSQLEALQTPPGLFLSTGPEQCATIPSGCYLASQYAIDFNLAGERERLTYGQHATRGGYVFVHAGYDVGTAQLQGCLDGAPAGVAAELWAAPTPTDAP